MELYQLRTFTTVAQTGHLTRAAEQLAISQSALSAQIKALEEEFGMPLFVRTAKGMVLTSAGKDLLARAKKVLAASDQLLHRARTLQDELVGTVRVGLNEDSKYLRIARLCNLASGKYARLNLDIVNSSSQVIVKDILAGMLDCGFVFGEYSGSVVSGVFLCTQPILITAPIAWKEKISRATWHDLLKLPWAWQSLNCPCRTKAEEFFKENNLGIPRALFTADQDETILAIVESGAIGIVKEPDAIAAEHQGKIVIWQGGSLEVDLSFVYKKDRENDPLIQAIVDLVQQIWLVDVADASEGTNDD